MKQEMRKAAESLVVQGRKMGAEIETTLSRGDAFSVSVRRGEIESLTEASTYFLSMRAIVDQKTASASSSDLSPETLKAVLKDCIQRARFSGKDPFCSLPEEVLPYTDPDTLDLYDPEIEVLPAPQKIAAARETERIALEDHRIVNSHGSEFSTVVSEILLVNSRGFSGSFSQTACSCGIHLQAGEDKIVEDGWHDSSRKFSDLMKPESIAGIAVRRATRMIGARKIPTQKVPVIFEAQITASMLRFLATCIMGDSIYLNHSFLAGKLGQQIASSIVTVVDDGLIPGTLGSRPFDAEGIPTRRTMVIEKGILQNYLTDTYSSRKLNLKSTGNCPGTHNFFLEKGSASAESILAGLDRGLLVTGLIGQGMVPTTGDLSRGAFGLWIENGEILHPVDEVTISGNLGKMLMQIESIGDDLTFRRSVAGPTIRISEMTVGGAGS